MRFYKVFLVAGLAMGMLSCKKESPITDIGNPTASNAARATLRVTLNNRAPVVGDSIVQTASTWHVNDKIDKIEFSETIVEKFAVNLTLANTTLNSIVDAKPVFLVVDSVAKDNIFRTISNQNNEFNSFFETFSDAYVIRDVYKKFTPKDIKDADLINSLTDEGFASLKNHLGFNINAADYRIMFPGSPSTHFSGALLSSIGRANLNANLTKQLLISNGLQTATKKGDLTVSLKVKVFSEATASNEVVNVFVAKY